MTFKFNPLIPELTVTDVKNSLQFYQNVLFFNIAYSREEDGLYFLEYQG